MLWHIVRFTFPAEAAEDDRRALEAGLVGLEAQIDEVRYLAVGRDLDDPAITGLVTAFDDEQALAVYRDHPDHQPVVARARELCERIDRLDILADAPPVGAWGRSG
jgi:hypothetical protein